MTKDRVETVLRLGLLEATMSVLKELDKTEVTTKQEAIAYSKAWTER